MAFIYPSIIMLKKHIIVVSVIFFAAIAWAFCLFGNDNVDVSASTLESATAKIMHVDFGPAYLRLEQVHPDVTARFLLFCYNGRMHWNAGIVTSPELSISKLKQATKNYLEIDSEEVTNEQGDIDAKAVDSTLWILQSLDNVQVTALKKAHTLGAWTEDGSDFRWGAFMNIENIRGKIISFIQQCK